MILVDNINTYCETTQTTIAAFERNCKLGKGIVRLWKCGNNKNPAITTMMRIEDATGISMSHWLKEGGIDEYFRKHPSKSKGAGKKAK